LRTRSKLAVLERRDELLVEHLRLVVARRHILRLRGEALALHNRVVQLRVGVADLLGQHEALEALRQARLGAVALGQRAHDLRTALKARGSARGREAISQTRVMILHASKQRDVLALTAQ
jgi:hypothetical protein